MRILARTPHNAVVQLDETDTKASYVVTFDVDISTRNGEMVYTTHSYEISPHDGKGPTQRDIIGWVVDATTFLSSVIRSLHS